MAILQTLTTSFLQDILQAGQNLAVDTLKMALYTSSATLDRTTTAYTASNEVVGTGYTAGGKTLTGVTLNTATDGTVYVDFADAIWTPATFTARGALIYNSTRANKSIAVLNFGADKTSTTTFTVQMPANNSTAALLRFK